MFKKMISVFVIVILFLSITPTDGVASLLNENIIGSYFSFGTYCGEPIVWRAVKWENDSLLLVSDEIICFKAYDEDSARWSTSDIRHWLNSEEESVEGVYNEKGFLSSDNFTDAEKSILKVAAHTSVINEVDAAYATSGEKPMDIKAQPTIDEDELALSYRESVDDRIFLPSISEIALLNSYDFGIEYNMATPTKYAAANTDFGVKHGANWYYWLSDAVSFSTDVSLVRMASVVNTITYTNANTENVGIRPMCFVSDDYFISNGTGSKDCPYKISGEDSLFISSEDFYVYEGKGFNIDIVSKPANLNISKYINGVKVDDDNFVPKAGINEVFFTADNDSGEIVYSSNKLTFYGVSYNIETVIWERDFESGNVFDGFSREVYSDSEDTALIVEADESHGKALQFKSYNLYGTPVNASAQTIDLIKNNDSLNKISKLSFEFMLHDNSVKESLVIMRRNIGGFYWLFNIFEGVLNIKSVSGKTQSIKIESKMWYEMEIFLNHEKQTVTIACGKTGGVPKILCYDGYIDSDEFSYTQLAEFAKAETSDESVIWYDNIGIYYCTQNASEDLFVSEKSELNNKFVFRIENPTGSGLASAWLFKANYNGNRLVAVKRELVTFKNGEKFMGIEVPKDDERYETKAFLTYKDLSSIKFINVGK